MPDAEQGDKTQPDRVEVLQERVELGRALFALIRDSAIFLFLFALVAVFVVEPSIITDRLREGNVKSVNVGFASLALESSVTALRTVEQTEREVGQVLNAAQAIAADDPEVRQLVARLQNRVETLQSAGTQLEKAAGRQQQILLETSPAAARIRGWVSVHNNVADLHGQPPRRGAIGTVRRRPLRVRTAPGTESPVIGVLPADSDFEIVNLGQPPRLPWAEVVQR